MSGCNLCPRQCNVERSRRAGPCTAGSELLVGSIVIHRGEEPPLVGGAGSGAIFFSGCPLRCSYCQNRQISHNACGRPLTPPDLASYMAKLQDSGCSNINLVTPTHYTPQILEALEIVRDLGLTIPVMVNSSGYESTGTLRRWRGHAEIYLMDLKYGDNVTGALLSEVPDYWDRAREAIEELWEWCGPLVVDERGWAARGLIVRHLVLPGMFSNPFAVLEFLAGISLDIPVSIMSQYNPGFYQGGIGEMKRGILPGEYSVVLERAMELGFSTIFSQDMEAPGIYVPDFKQEAPFGDFQKLL